MNKIELIQTLSDVIRNNPEKNIFLILLTEGKIITGYPVFDDSDLSVEIHGSASDVRQALKSIDTEPSHLISSPDGMLLRNVAIYYHGEKPFSASSLFVFYDSIIAASAVP